MQTSATVVMLLLVSISTVYNQNFKTAKPVKDCTASDLPTGAKIQFRVFLTKFTMDPPCEEDYCTIKKGMKLEITAQGTPLRDGKAAILKIYEQNLAAITGSLLPAKVYIWNEDACQDQQKFNITCPYQADVPIYAHYKGNIPDVPSPAAFPASNDFIAMMTMEDEEQNLLMCYTVKFRNQYYTAARK